MEEVLLRFFHLGQQIFGQIDDQSFINCRTVGRSWKINIDAEDYAWNKIAKKFPCELGKLPLHIAAMTGQTEKFMNLLAEAEDKNPTEINGVTPYHLAAKNGHLEICHLICTYQMTLCDGDINPPDNHKYTPFHYSAASGHLSICKFFIDSVTNKNPRCDQGATPLHLATANGHYLVCKLIIENVYDKNPKMKNGMTPLHVSALWGHVEIFNLIISNVGPLETKPLDSYGHTPMFYWKISNYKGCNTTKKEDWPAFFGMLFHPSSYCYRHKIPPCSFINLHGMCLEW